MLPVDAVLGLLPLQPSPEQGDPAGEHPVTPGGQCLPYVFFQLGPFGRCPQCGGLTWKPYRCNAVVDHDRDDEPVVCGKDLTQTTVTTAGNDGFRG